MSYSHWKQPHDNVAVVMAAEHYEWDYDSPTHLEWRNPTPDEDEILSDNGWSDPESDNDYPLFGVVLVEPEGTKCLWRRGWDGSVFRNVSDEDYDDNRTIEMEG